MPKPNVVKRGSEYLCGVDVKVMVEREKPAGDANMWSVVE